MHILSQVAGFVSENGLILCPNLAGFLARSGRFLTSEIGWFYFTTDKTINYRTIGTKLAECKKDHTGV